MKKYCCKMIMEKPMANRKLIRFIKPIIEFVEFRVLHIDDSPERIAGGVFAGVLIAYTPLIGLHLLIGLFVAMIFRVNKFATLSFVWISNVFTLIPIYYPSYLLGRKILNIFGKEPEMSLNEILRVFRGVLRELDVSSIIDPAFWDSLRHLFTRVGAELFIGGILIGTVVATLAYQITVKSIKRHRQRPKGRLKRKLLAKIKKNRAQKASISQQQ